MKRQQSVLSCTMVSELLCSLKGINQFWLVVSTNPSEKYEFVSWDDEIPNIWKVIKNVPNHQPVLIIDLLRPEIEPEIEILL